MTVTVDMQFETVVFSASFECIACIFISCLVGNDFPLIIFFSFGFTTVNQRCIDMASFLEDKPPLFHHLIDLFKDPVKEHFIHQGITKFTDRRFIREYHHRYEYPGTYGR